MSNETRRALTDVARILQREGWAEGQIPSPPKSMRSGVGVYVAIAFGVLALAALLGFLLTRL